MISMKKKLFAHKNSLHIKKRKALFYSLITLVLLAPVILFITYYTQTSSTESKAVVTKTVGKEIANFVDSTAVDFENALQISGKSSVVALVSQVVSNGVPVDDAQAALSSLALNASYQGVYYSVLENTSLDRWQQKVESEGNAFGLNVSITVLSANVTQLDSFNLLYTSSASVNASFPSYDIKLFKYYNTSTIVSILGVEDPLYALRTNGLLERSLVPAPFYPASVTDIDAAVDDEYYFPNADAPSFLDRLENKTILSAKYANPNAVVGLESFVNLFDLSSQGLSIALNKSVVDHYYFNETQPQGTRLIGSTYAWLYLDQQHAGTYGVSGQLGS